MVTMRLLAAVVTLAVGVSARAEPHAREAVSLLSVWPAQLNTKLSVKDAQDAGKWSVETTQGGVLAIETTTSTAVELPSIDASSISSIQVTWVAPTGSSSAWRRVAASASIHTLPVVFSAGLHVHVVAQERDQDVVEVEAATRGLLVGLNGGFNELRSGLFARSLCVSTVFTDRLTGADESCFSASLPFDAVPVSSSNAWARTTEDLQLRVHSVSLSKPQGGGHGFDVDTLSVFETVGGTLLLPRDLVNSAAHESVGVVTEIDDSTGVASVGSLTATGLQVTSKTAPLRSAVKADVAVDILGEGFHRQVRIRLSPDSAICPHEAAALPTLRVVLPLTTAVYADLDELRRMERFGELTLHSPAKHIEIERPMAVSSQHVIALDFPADPTKSVHEFTFPIHLRYQSPTNGSYYAPATMIAPELLVSCGVITQHPTGSQAESLGKPWKTFFSRWLQTQKTSEWQRIAPPTPLAVDAVLVPVGFIPHGGLVSGLTISVTSLGALVLGYVAIKSSRASSRSSQSQWRPASE